MFHCSYKKEDKDKRYKAKGDPLGWSVSSISSLTDIDHSDVIYASFATEVHVYYVLYSILP